MPHIVIESTPRLFVAIDFVALFSALHRRLAADGHAVLDDFKSRVHVTDRYLAGDDPDAEFVVARLVTTNPRPKTTQRAMAALIHDALRAAIEAAPRSYWWQCCVLIEPFDKADYLKTDSHG
jgi:5-carboxymethyl-2-hydroxymuconate isomerase